MIIPAPCDMHVHFRQGDMIPMTVSHAEQQGFEYVLAMPNTKPPVVTASDVREYRQKLAAHSERLKFVMTSKLLPSTEPQAILEAAQEADAFKLYTNCGTTHSEDSYGANAVRYQESHFRDQLAAVVESGKILCVHGEMPGSDCQDAESDFLVALHRIIRKFPKLRIVLEHITTAEAVKFIESQRGEVAATITLHHLMTTLNDVVGGFCRPHNHCMPIPKRTSDRNALIRAATSGNPCFFNGSDSAPHIISTKECAEGCAGVFSGPVIMPGLLEVFQKVDLMARLPAFASRFARDFYRLPAAAWDVEYVEKPWVVPAVINDVVPFLAGRTMRWSRVT